MYGRSDLYIRLGGGLRALLEQRLAMEEDRSEMAMRVNLQDALNRLQYCPCCGGALIHHEGYELERSCECGDFVITDVYSDGDVAFTFKMNAQPEESGE